MVLMEVEGKGQDVLRWTIGIKTKIVELESQTGPKVAWLGIHVWAEGFGSLTIRFATLSEKGRFDFVESDTT